MNLWLLMLVIFGVLVVFWQLLDLIISYLSAALRREDSTPRRERVS